MNRQKAFLVLYTLLFAFLPFSSNAGQVFAQPGLPEAPDLIEYYSISVSTADDNASDAGNCTLRDALNIVSIGRTSGTINGCVIERAGEPSELIFVIFLPLGSYTYTLNGTPLNIEQATVYIEGDNPNQTIIQAASAPESVSNAVLNIFHFVEQANLRNLSIRNAGTGSTEWGAIFIESDLRLENVAVYHNAGHRGAGIYNDSGATITLVNAQIYENHATELGGGIFSNGLLEIDNSQIFLNTAELGAGIFSLNQAHITDSSFYENHVRKFGGAITNFGDDLTITGSDFHANRADDGGGAIFTDRGLMQISQSFFTDNSAVGGGGAIHADGGATNMVNTTLASNSAQDGGAVYIDSHSMTMSHVTIYANSGSQEGGGIAQYGSLQIHNSIVANSLAGGDCFFSGSTENRIITGVNFDSDASCSGFTTPQAGETLDLNPLLNDSGLLWLVSLGSNSIALDSSYCTEYDGSDVLIDQRGVTRPQGTACEAGAYEVDRFSPQISDVSITSDAADGRFLPYTPVQVSFTITDPENPAALLYTLSCENGTSEAGSANLTTGSVFVEASCTVTETVSVTTDHLITVHVYEEGTEPLREDLETAIIMIEPISASDYQK